MKTLKFTLIGILAVFVSSCERLDSQKIKSTTITGQVRTYGTEEAVRGAPVGVMLWKKLKGTSDGFEWVDSVSTDIDGWYSITQNLDEREDYYMSVTGYSKKLYVETQWLSRSFTRRASVTVGINQTIHLEPVAYGYVDFHFVSRNPKHGVEYTYNLGAGAYETFYTSVNTHRIWDFGGNLNRRISLNYYDGSIDSSFNWQEEFFPVAFETISMTIEF